MELNEVSPPTECSVLVRRKGKSNTSYFPLDPYLLLGDMVLVYLGVVGTPAQNIHISLKDQLEPEMGGGSPTASM